MNDRRGLLIVISGPSGVGKDTLIRRLLEQDPNLRYSVSCTTRPPRRGEVDGVDYSFVSRARFQQLLDEGIKRNTETSQDMEARRVIATREMDYASRYDHVVVNDELERAVSEILAITRQARASQT